MIAGQLILTAAVLSGAAALVAGLGSRADRVARALSWIFVLLAGAAVLLLAVSLAFGDFALRYVWQHSATYQPLNERLAALVAGSEGSMLVWLLLASALAAWASEQQVRGRWPDRSGGRLVRLVLLAIAVVLGVASLVSAPFELMADFAPAAAEPGVTVAEGRGLNPVLANPWMVPHTVLTLAAFALVGLAAAVGAVQLVRIGQRRPEQAATWESRRVAAGRSAWLVLTLALFAGIVWAYEEMSFGWFWSWDPVESATLAVWLVLTAALHAGRGAPSADRGAMFGPALACAALLAVLFASVVARSGLHPSVHAFAGGPAGAIMVVALSVALPLWVVALAYAWRGSTGRRAPDADSGRVRSLTTPAAVTLAVAAGLLTWGLAYPIVASRVFGLRTDLDAQFFSLTGYLLAVGCLLLIGAGLSATERRRRDRGIVFSVFATLTVVAAVIKPIDGLTLLPAGSAGAGSLLGVVGQISVLSLLPPAVYALLGIAERLGSTGSRSPRRRSWTAYGHAALHAGVVVVLLGVTLSTLFASSTTVAVLPRTGTAAATADPLAAPERARALAVHLLGLARTEQRNILGEAVELRETASLEVLLDGRFIARGEATLSSFPQREMGRHVRVLLDRGLLSDTQVIYHGLAEANAAGIPVTVRRIPLVSLVWAGMALFVMGMLLVRFGGAASMGQTASLRRGRGR